MREVRLDSIAEVRLGRQRSPKNHEGPTMRPYLRAANVGWSGIQLDDVKMMNFTESEMATYRLEPGDILLGEASGSAAEVGKPALWSGEIKDCAFQNTLLRVRSRVAEPRYLLHFFRFQAESGAFAAQSRGVGIHHLGREALASYSIPIPPIDEQRRIAAILDQADALRTQRRRALSRLDDLVGSLFSSMFVDQAGSSEILINLVIEPLQNGAYFPADRYAPSGTEMVHMSDAFTGLIKRGSLKRVLCNSSDIAKWGLKSTDLLVARRSLNYSGSAKPCLIPSSGEPLIFESSLIRVRPDQSRILTQYLYHLLSSKAYRERFVFPAVTGTTISGISQSNLNRLPIPVPPLDIQQSFVDRVNAIEDLKSIHSAGLAQLDTLFASLQHRAFRGEL